MRPDALRQTRTINIPDAIAAIDKLQQEANQTTDDVGRLTVRLDADKVRRIVPDMPGGNKDKGGPNWQALVRHYTDEGWIVSYSEGCQPGQSGDPDQVVFREKTPANGQK